MTDLEMTKLCAEAMGYKIVYPNDASLPIAIESELGAGLYNPLHDDAQAMALVKRFKPYIGYAPPEYHVHIREGNYWGQSEDLNRAIVECVTKLAPKYVRKYARLAALEKGKK